MSTSTRELVRSVISTLPNGFTVPQVIASVQSRASVGDATIRNHVTYFLESGWLRRVYVHKSTNEPKSIYKYHKTERWQATQAQTPETTERKTVDNRTNYEKAMSNAMACARAAEKDDSYTSLGTLWYRIAREMRIAQKVTHSRYGGTQSPKGYKDINVEVISIPEPQVFEVPVPTAPPVADVIPPEDELTKANPLNQETTGEQTVAEPIVTSPQVAAPVTEAVEAALDATAVSPATTEAKEETVAVPATDAAPDPATNEASEGFPA